jgi:hypothetical protein
VFHEFDADSTIHTNRLHWEGFPRLAWEALSTAGYLTPLTYEVFELERYGVPRCRVIVTVLPHQTTPTGSTLVLSTGDLSPTRSLSQQLSEC